MRHVIIAGGAGYVGGILAAALREHDVRVIVLSRRARPNERGIKHRLWDGRTLGDWTADLDGADAVINLAGRSVNCRYHRRNRDAIMGSRTESTRVLGEALRRCERPPRVWLNASTATIYRHSFDRPMDDLTGEIGGTPEAKDVFSVDVAQAWEKVFFESVTPGTRKVALRSAMVFSNAAGDNAVYPTLRRLVRLGLGGRMGTGRQMVSWIHEHDFCRAVWWLLSRSALQGPVNLAAPEPVTNAAMMRMLRQSEGVPFGLPAHRALLELGAFFLRTETELIIKSRYVLPRRLTDDGFDFQYKTLPRALTALKNVRNGRDACRD